MQGATVHISLETQCQTVQVKKPYALDTLGLMHGPTAAADPSWRLSDSKDDPLWLKSMCKEWRSTRLGGGGWRAGWSIGGLYDRMIYGNFGSPGRW